jgi:hypothetical protein
MCHQQAFCHSSGINPSDQNRQVLLKPKWGFRQLHDERTVHLSWTRRILQESRLQVNQYR